jgi:hypothetical protein
MKLVAAIGACAMVLAWPREGRADPANQNECEAAFARAQELADHGQLVKARSELEKCEASSCDDALRHRCMMRSDLLVEDTPTVVLSVTDDDGAPVDGVRVSLDRVLVASQIDGRAIPVEPGVHEFMFYKGDAVIARKKLVILQGQHNRVIAASLHPEVPHAAAAHADDAGPLRVTRTATPQRGSYVPSYLVLGLGVTSLGGAALLTTWGRGDNKKLADCTPNCPQASVDHIHRLYLGADISLGVGITAIAVGSWLAWRTHSHHALAVQPTASGFLASFTGAL